MCRQLTQLWEILFRRVECAQVRSMTHSEHIRCHLHHLHRQLIFFLLLFENGGKCRRLLLLRLAMKSLCLASDIGEVGLLRQHELLLIVTLFGLVFLFILAAFRKIVRYFASHAEIENKMTEYLKLTFSTNDSVSRLLAWRRWRSG